MEFSIVERCWDAAPWGAADVLATTLLGGAAGWAATWQLVRPASRFRIASAAPATVPARALPEEAC